MLGLWQSFCTDRQAETDSYVEKAIWEEHKFAGPWTVLVDGVR